jgi:phage regulator Rha-like protein
LHAWGAPSSTRPARNGCGAGIREGAAQKRREGKRHDNVLRDIDALIAQAPGTALKIERSEYADASGKKNRCFVMDRDGFMLLAMGFTGEEALISQAPQALPNFGQGYYELPNTGTQRHRCFTMDRDGFMLLAMGFTGEDALKPQRRSGDARIA